MNYLSDPNAERALLSIILNSKKDIYVELLDIGLGVSSFTLNHHKVIFDSIQSCYKENDKLELDPPLIISASKTSNYPNWLVDPENLDYLEKVFEFKANVKNAELFAKKIKKLEVIRNIIKKLDESKDELLEFTGEEAIGDIFGVVENKIIDMSSSIITDSDVPIKLADIIDDYIQERIDSPIEQPGISTSFPRLDYYWGGGLRNGSIYVICARAKGGKSLFLNKVGMHITRNLDIPVLYMYTEMSWKDQVNRMLGAATGVNVRDVETGAFAREEDSLAKILKERDLIKQKRFYCESIAGKSLDAQINIMRRWVIREVGLNNDGTAKPCVILYDYLKLMDSGSMKNMQEYQALGFMLMGLENFAIKYQLPILTACQLNKEGLVKEDESAIGVSDRISWFCSGAALLKKKSDQELAMEQYGAKYGNRKLIPIIARYGPAIEDGNFINCSLTKETCDIVEGITAYEALKHPENPDPSEGIVDMHDDSSAEIIF